MTEETTTAVIDDETAELIEVMRQRSATYMLLARLFRSEIDAELLDEMHGMLYPAEVDNTAIDTGYRYIATYLSNLWDESLRELKVDYARTFLGHGVDGFSAAYPYESVYTSEKRLMMQEARDEVLAVYRSRGIEKTEDWKEGEDHASLEMEFERIMGDRTIEALEAGDMERAGELLAVQKDFLNDHLAAWLPMLTADMKHYSDTKMYQGLAYLAEGFVETDRGFLDDVTADLRSTEAE